MGIDAYPALSHEAAIGGRLAPYSSGSTGRSSGKRQLLKPE